uniref:MARVEL domain-containing protein n=1 Tax=Caenorhabditis tropicalis TaxID=1561998 RepID=A0A1I7UH58_9PELO
MVKEANFSFYGELPTSKTTRHCCGLVENSTVYSFLSFLTVVQLISLIIINLRPELDYLNPYGKKEAGGEKEFLILVAAVWILAILVSFVGYLRKIEWMHAPLLLIEAPFFLLSIGLVGFFLWSIGNPAATENKELLRKTICSAVLAIFHGYYTYVIFCSWSDARQNWKVAEFIRRQDMIDDVCEEMMWEEEQEQMYAQVRTFPMSGIYQESLSVYSSSDCSTSICSAEVTINTMYNTYTQDRRFVTFYEDDENCCYY